MNVSVIIPCRNTEAYLGQAIGSVLEQSRPPGEIIVVDDGSTDGSLAIALAFGRQHPDVVRVYARRSGSAARTRNLGALLATGDALMFLDADDVLGPEVLESLGEALAGTPGGVAIGPWVRLTQRNGVWIERPQSCAPRQPGQDALDAWLTGWYHPPCAVLWSRDAFETSGRWDEDQTVNDDGDLMMRALVAGVPLIEATQGVSYYRRLPPGEISLSGTRTTRAGLLRRLEAIDKVAWLLEQRERLARHRTALAQAYAAIAVDAGDTHRDVAGRARRRARHVRPRVLTRIARRLRALVWPARPGPQAPPPPPVAVRWGLEHAAAVDPAASGTATGIVRSIRFPEVTVIIPTYNRAGLLPRALSSVLAQSFADFEVLVVDDGSTDETAAVVRAWPDRRVRYLPQRNRGAGAARNRGLREARGEFVAFLDSDDEWLPGKLAAQMEIFRSGPARLGLVYTGVESVRAGGRRTVERPDRRGNIYRDMLARNVIHGGGSNVLMRRNVVATVGFFIEGLAAIEDYEYWLRITRFFTVDFVDAPLVRYFDPEAPARRSLARRANLDARWWLYRKYAREMRRARMAHLFLLKSARRALWPPEPDFAEARRLAALAVIEAPLSRLTLGTLGRVLLHREVR